VIERVGTYFFVAADIGVYGMVDPDIFQGRDETIRQEMKANLLFILLLNICTVTYSAIYCCPYSVSQIQCKVENNGWYGEDKVYILCFYS
jgi:hypothetical protein